MASLNERPHHVAASFAIGVFIGMSPLIGLHTILGLVIAYLINLNRVVTIIGVYVTNPWTVVPIYTFGTWAGTKLLKVEGVTERIDWTALSLNNVTHELRELFMPFIVGTFFIGAISAVISYFVIYALIKKRSDA
ncbi:MAG: DUF2062 domain-containing protein [Nitrospirota bacterium]|nr:MAG: DUF2062 domain-containing protein [Nitrospirota bacterium]